MSSLVNYIDKIFVGQFGNAITVTIVDSTGTAVDISGYDGTNQVLVNSPDGQSTVTWTASFGSDGTDGVLSVTPADGDLDRTGEWKGQAKLTNTGGTIVAYSKIFTMVVEETLG